MEKVKYIKMVKISEEALSNEFERMGLEMVINSPEIIESRIRTIREGKYDIYLINIESREDRLRETLEVLERYPILGIKVFKAIKCSRGQVGCAASHVSLVNYAKSKGMKYIIVMEDDNEFDIDCSELEYVLDSLISNLDKWNIYNANPSYHADTFEINHIFEDFVDVSWGNTTNFIIYSETSFYKMLTKCDLTQPIDVFIPWNFRQAVYLKNLVAYQRPSYSDIDEMDVGARYYDLSMGEYKRMLRVYQSKAE